LGSGGSREEHDMSHLDGVTHDGDHVVLNIL
jgi:hypothetical protein